jgi:hypothetical protein
VTPHPQIAEVHTCTSYPRVGVMVMASSAIAEQRRFNSAYSTSASSAECTLSTRWHCRMPVPCLALVQFRCDSKCDNYECISIVNTHHSTDRQTHSAHTCEPRSCSRAALALHIHTLPHNCRHSCTVADTILVGLHESSIAHREPTIRLILYRREQAIAPSNPTPSNQCHRLFNYASLPVRLRRRRSETTTT